jgi:hypothetical protein
VGLYIAIGVVGVVGNRSQTLGEETTVLDQTTDCRLKDVDIH